jgi:hypothetical protein
VAQDLQKAATALTICRAADKDVLRPEATLDGTSAPSRAESSTSTLPNLARFASHLTCLLHTHLMTLLSPGMNHMSFKS